MQEIPRCREIGLDVRVNDVHLRVGRLEGAFPRTSHQVLPPDKRHQRSPCAFPLRRGWCGTAGYLPPFPGHCQPPVHYLCLIFYPFFFFGFSHIFSSFISFSRRYLYKVYPPAVVNNKLFLRLYLASLPFCHGPRSQGKVTGVRTRSGRRRKHKLQSKGTGSYKIIDVDESTVAVEYPDGIVEKLNLDRTVKAPGPLEEGDTTMPDFDETGHDDSNERPGASAKRGATDAESDDDDRYVVEKVVSYRRNDSTGSRVEIEITKSVTRQMAAETHPLKDTIIKNFTSSIPQCIEGSHVPRKRC